VKREFFSLLVRDLFSPDFNMFQLEAEQYVFNPMSLHSADGDHSADGSAAASSSSSSSSRLSHLNAEALSTLGEYELVGIVLGLSIYNGVQLEVRFPSIVYKKLLAKSKPPSSDSNGSAKQDAPEYTLADLVDSHPDLAKGLQQLLTYPATTSAELEDTFGVQWSVDHSIFGATITRELIPGGATTPVTLENRAAYVDAYVKYILHDSIELQFDAFAKGFFKVVSKQPLELLTHPSDLELLICGNQSPNWPELESAASYDGWSHHSSGRPSAPVIAHFWAFFHSLSVELKLKVLAFVTGSNRIPIKGLKHSKFVVMHGGENQEKLPESHVSPGTDMRRRCLCDRSKVRGLWRSGSSIALPLSCYLLRPVSINWCYLTIKIRVHFEVSLCSRSQRAVKDFNSSKNDTLRCSFITRSRPHTQAHTHAILVHTDCSLIITNANDLNTKPSSRGQFEFVIACSLAIAWSDPARHP
jgi:hypothetical protein